MTSFLRPFVIGIAGAVALYFGVNWIGHLGIAHGATQALQNPLGTADSSVTGAESLLVTYGPVIGGMYLLYALANALLAKYHASSWLAQGKRLAIATSVLGIAGAALQAQVTGAPWTVILMAAVAAAFKLITPTVAQRNAASTATAASSAAVLAVLLLGAVSMQTACSGGARERVAAGVAAFLDCEGADIDAQMLADAKALATSSVRDAISGAKGDAAALKAALKADAAPLKSDVFRCGFAAAVAALTAPPTPGTLPAQHTLVDVTLGHTDPAQVRSAFSLAARELGWATVHVSGQVL